jgi:4-diphosphocytidyl-2-C-methyl-D-erythritol kinase
VEAISLTSCAKVNLGLRVLSKRSDGFHEIETILQAVDLQDHIRITPLPERSVHVWCDHPEVPSGPANLAHQAAQRILDEYPRLGGCDIEIRKHIPPAAGLGGGSSNAATTLIGLNKLFRLNLSSQKLHLMASRLGSDVPFFLRGGTALARGRGERLTQLRLKPDFFMVVVKPDISISTQWAYGRVKITLTSNSRFIKLDSLKGIMDIGHLLSLLDNDLEGAVRGHYPSIDEIKSDLLSKGAMGAAMSGSGSAVFGVVRTKAEADLLAGKMRRPQWQIFIVRPMREV